MEKNMLSFKEISLLKLVIEGQQLPKTTEIKKIIQIMNKYLYFNANKILVL